MIATSLRRILFVLVALAACAAAHAAPAVRVWLDRSTMQLGETVTLNVEVTGDNGASKPDFSALEKDFNLLGTQNSSSINIINGQTASKLLWAVGLEPKRAGTLVIPALRISGVDTDPITLTVQPASASASGKAGDDLFVDVSADPRTLYVQQQMRLTVKLYYAVNLTEGSLDEPQGEGVVVHKLGQDSNYVADVQGRRYHVLERHYAIQVEKSGSLTLAAIGFRGRAINPNDFNSFFNRGRAVSARAEPIELDVKARPAASGSDAWIPAQSVTLTAEGVDATTSARVGEPITLTLREKAQGQGFEQLPELKLPKIEGADVYPDKEVTHNRDDGAWLFGERERKFAIVPNRAGKLELPAIGLAWWDVVHDRAASADVPAVTLDVAPSAASADTKTAPASPASAAPPAPVSTVRYEASDSAELHFWRVLAFTALLLWAATLLGVIAWVRSDRRRTERSAAIAEPRRRATNAASAFDRACAHADLAEAARALVAWAQDERPSIRHLGELAQAVSDAAQKQLIGELMRALYGARSDGASSVDLAARLRSAFRRGPVFADPAPARAPASALPPLYPFRT